jgi:hypothetical protein
MLRSAERVAVWGCIGIATWCLELEGEQASCWIELSREVEALLTLLTLSEAPEIRFPEPGRARIVVKISAPLFSSKDFSETFTLCVSNAQDHPPAEGRRVNPVVRHSTDSERDDIRNISERTNG